MVSWIALGVCTLAWYTHILRSPTAIVLICTAILLAKIGFAVDMIVKSQFQIINHGIKLSRQAAAGDF